MQITVTTVEAEVYPIDVPADMTLQDFCAVVESETRIPAASMIVLHNGRPLLERQKTLTAYGFADGDMVLVQKLPTGAANPAPPAAAASSQPGGSLPLIDFSTVRLGTAPASSQAAPQPGATLQNTGPETIRQMLLAAPHELALMKERNPALAAVINDPAGFQRVLSEQRAETQRREAERQQLFSGDPFDPEIQRRIAEEIQQNNIDNAMEQAIEYMPESFAQVIMLYINCTVNGHPVKAFVDSGAQMTIMSQRCAQRCNIERLIDRRWAGIAKGVGEQKILGRVHMGQIQIEQDFIANSFSILEDQPMDLLIGLDLLKRHQCCIDLRKGILLIGTTGTETKFLHENELPPTALGSAAAAGTSAESAVTPQPATPEEEQKILSITQHGYSRDAALQEIRNHQGDVDAALAALLDREPPV